MSSMKSINQQVWRAMELDPAIMRDLQRKLINSRALAKYLIKKYDLHASMDAVISSIRRFPIEQHKEEERVLRSIFKDSVISTRNNIACVTINRTPKEVFERLSKEMPDFRMTTAINSVKIIVENGDAEKIGKLFKRKEIERGLSEISVTVSEKALKTKGVLARIAEELALANINLHEFLVCPPQFLLYVAQKDIVKAHERIIGLTS